jgi:hypothetical protein
MIRLTQLLAYLSIASFTLGCHGQLQKDLDQAAAQIASDVIDSVPEPLQITLPPVKELKTGQPGRLSEEIGYALIHALSTHKGVLKVQARAQIPTLIEELMREQSDLFDPKSENRLGGLLSSVEAYLVTTYSEQPGQVTIQASLIGIADKEVQDFGSIRGYHIAGGKATYRTAQPTKLSAGLRSAAVPGWGQLYKGERSKGMKFFGAVTLTATGGILTNLLSHEYHSKAKNARRQVDRDRYKKWSDRFYYTSIFVGGIAGILHIYNIIDALESEERLPPQAQTRRIGFHLRDGVLIATYFKTF